MSNTMNKSYLWALVVLEHVIGDDEAMFAILHLDVVLEVELDGVTRKVILGNLEAIFSFLRLVAHHLLVVLQRLDPPDKPSHGQVQASQTRLYEAVDPPYSSG